MSKHLTKEEIESIFTEIINFMALKTNNLVIENKKLKDGRAVHVRCDVIHPVHKKAEHYNCLFRSLNTEENNYMIIKLIFFVTLGMALHPSAGLHAYIEDVQATMLSPDSSRNDILELLLRKRMIQLMLNGVAPKDLPTALQENIHLAANIKEAVDKTRGPYVIAK